MAAPYPIDPAFVLRAAECAGLDVDEQALPGVIANLERIATFARLLDDVPLAPTDEAAPVWRP